MKLEDFYAALGGDLEGTMERICSRRLVERFILSTTISNLRSIASSTKPSFMAATIGSLLGTQYLPNIFLMSSLLNLTLCSGSSSTHCLAHVVLPLPCH